MKRLIITACLLLAVTALADPFLWFDDMRDMTKGATDWKMTCLHASQIHYVGTNGYVVIAMKESRWSHPSTQNAVKNWGKKHVGLAGTNALTDADIATIQASVPSDVYIKATTRPRYYVTNALALEY